MDWVCNPETQSHLNLGSQFQVEPLILFTPPIGGFNVLVADGCIQRFKMIFCSHLLRVNPSDNLSYLIICCEQMLPTEAILSTTTFLRCSAPTKLISTTALMKTK